jgi:hypothetical protein
MASKVIGLVPAYGRDYKSQDEVKFDFNQGLDFLISDVFHPYAGKPVNKGELEKEGVTEVKIRYASLQKVVVVKIS